MRIKLLILGILLIGMISTSVYAETIIIQPDELVGKDTFNVSGGWLENARMRKSEVNNPKAQKANSYQFSQVFFLLT